jgi:hypothetical protein
VKSDRQEPCIIVAFPRLKFSRVYWWFLNILKIFVSEAHKLSKYKFFKDGQNSLLVMLGIDGPQILKVNDKSIKFGNYRKKACIISLFSLICKVVMHSLVIFGNFNSEQRPNSVGSKIP